MAAETPQIFTLYPQGTPRAVAAGEALSLTLFVPGAAEPKGRPRARVVNQGGKSRVQWYTPKTTTDWEDTVIDHVKLQLRGLKVEGDDGGDFLLPLRGRILMAIRFNITKPPSYAKRVVHHTRKPDVDNLAKAVLDALVKGQIIADDNCVTDLAIAKRYLEPNHPVGVEIDLTVTPAET